MDSNKPESLLYDEIRRIIKEELEKHEAQLVEKYGLVEKEQIQSPSFKIIEGEEGQMAVKPEPHEKVISIEAGDLSIVQEVKKSKFGNYESLTDEELIKELEKYEEELALDEKRLSDPKLNYHAKFEAREDIKYDNEQISLIKELQEYRKNK